MQSVLSLMTVLSFYTDSPPSCTLHLHFSARPVLFTYLFMALVIEGLLCVDARGRFCGIGILLPVIFVAWANLHAGWLAALIFLWGSLFGRLLDRATKRVSEEEAPLLRRGSG